MEQDTYNDEETARRRDEAMRRALYTPPQPNPTKTPRKVKLDAEAGAEKRGSAGGAS